jgi:hypothetical protein
MKIQDQQIDQTYFHDGFNLRLPYGQIPHYLDYRDLHVKLFENLLYHVLH